MRPTLLRVTTSERWLDGQTNDQTFIFPCHQYLRMPGHGKNIVNIVAECCRKQEFFLHFSQSLFKPIFTIFNIQLPASHLQHPTSLPISNLSHLQRPTSNIQLLIFTFNLRSSIFNLQSLDFAILCQLQPSTFNSQQELQKGCRALPRFFSVHPSKWTFFPPTNYTSRAHKL